MLGTRRLSRVAAAVLGLALPTTLISSANADPYREMPVFSSQNGQLNLIMIAKRIDNSAVKSFFPGASGNGPDAWVYEMCKAPAWPVTATSCSGASVESFQGARIAVQPGDVLRVHFLNKLPDTILGQPLDSANVVYEPLIAYNPTNLHVHGMIVEPRAATASRNSWGDIIYVLAFNTANGFPGTLPTTLPYQPNAHVEVLPDSIDYEFNIPTNHPSGEFIVHPHPHGNTSNQMQAGMSDPITVGQLSDRLCDDPYCARPLTGMPHRHIFLKDVQYEAGPNNQGRLVTQIDHGFCDPASPKAGYCDGIDNTPGGGADHTGGKWFFPVSGQLFPEMDLNSSNGEVWTLTNASSNMVYDIRLTENGSGRDMAMQVVAVDGVSVDTSNISNVPGDLLNITGGKLRLVNCPKPAGLANKLPVCADSITMFGSARVDVWVTYRDANNAAVTPPAGTSATFRTAGVNTGPTGDSYPAVNLAKVDFTQPDVAKWAFLNIRPQPLYGPGAIFSTAAVPSNGPNAWPPVAGDCKALTPGHRRRIYYGVPPQLFNGNPIPSDYPQILGLGYEEIDAKGKAVPGTRVEIQPFDLNTTPPLCVPLGKGNTPVTEVWELVNLATEAHNFHIHQNKFHMVRPGAPVGSPLYTAALTSAQAGGAVQNVFMDNIALPPASDGCSVIADYWAGKCTANKITVEMPFKYAGDLVYHCHILDHEDAGMMNKIRIATNP